MLQRLAHLSLGLSGPSKEQNQQTGSLGVKPLSGVMGNWCPEQRRYGRQNDGKCLEPILTHLDFGWYCLVTLLTKTTKLSFSTTVVGTCPCTVFPCVSQSVSCCCMMNWIGQTIAFLICVVVWTNVCSHPKHSDQDGVEDSDSVSLF